MSSEKPYVERPAWQDELFDFDYPEEQRCPICMGEGITYSNGMPIDDDAEPLQMPLQPCRICGGSGFTDP